MNRPQPAFDACLAVLLLVLACSLGVVTVGALIAIAWRVVLG